MNIKKTNKIRKPNLFLVGASRTGTGSWNEYLAQHPEVFMADERLPNFFGEIKDTNGNLRTNVSYAGDDSGCTVITGQICSFVEFLPVMVNNFFADLVVPTPGEQFCIAGTVANGGGVTSENVFLCYTSGSSNPITINSVDVEITGNAVYGSFFPSVKDFFSENLLNVDNKEDITYSLKLLFISI